MLTRFFPCEGRSGQEAAEKEIGSEIPPDWYGGETDCLEKLCRQLLRRRPLVRELVMPARKSPAQPFPNGK